MMITIRIAFVRLLTAAAIGGTLGTLGTLVASSPAGAQSAAGPRWHAWVGCWRPAVQPASTELPPSDDVFDADRTRARRTLAMIDSARNRELSSRSPVVCVVPSTTEASVDVITLDSGKVASRYSVDASGRSVAIDRDGCTGVESARWSRDGLRVFLHSKVTCASALERTTNGVMSIASNGDWVDVQSVNAGGNQVVRTVRYRGAATPAGAPAEVASAVEGGRRLDARTATLAAGAPLTTAAIIEAAGAVDSSTVQAWLVERNDPFKVDARTLIALADGGVPGSVTDVMVALAHPEEFRFERGVASGGGMMGDGPLSRADSARIVSSYMWNRRGIGCDGIRSYSPYGWGWDMDPCDPFRDSRGLYGYGYGYGSGYGPYRYRTPGYDGYGYPGYYSYYGGPVVIVQAGSGPEHGRAVNGQGYTRRASGSSSDASSSRSSGSGDSGSSGSSSSGSSSGSSSSSGGDRTAHPRPPQ